MSGGVKYAVPNDLILTWFLTQIRFLFGSFILCYILALPYTVIILALSIVLADFRFYQDFTHAIEDYTQDNEEDF